jgi:hypothetical protein
MITLELHYDEEDLYDIEEGSFPFRQVWVITDHDGTNHEVTAYSQPHDVEVDSDLVFDVGGIKVSAVQMIWCEMILANCCQRGDSVVIDKAWLDQATEGCIDLENLARTY